MDLTGFLAARLGEDEAAAKAAAGHLSGRWVIDSDGDIQDEETGGGGNAYVACGPYDAGLDVDHAAHILRHDPARALRQVEAGRAILERWQYLKRHDAPGNSDPDEFEDYAVRPLAAVYSDHPDYDEAWKP